MNPDDITRHRGGIVTRRETLPSGNTATFITGPPMIIYPRTAGERLTCQLIGAFAVAVGVGLVLASMAVSTVMVLGCL